MSTNLILIPYDSYYTAISRSCVYPTNASNRNYSVKLMYAKGWINENSQLKLPSHMFDNDNKIPSLKLKYTLCAVMKDGTTKVVDLKDIDMKTNRLSALDRHYFILDETFTISKYVTDYRDIDLMYIKSKQISSETYINESTLELVCVHYHH